MNKKKVYKYIIMSSSALLLTSTLGFTLTSCSKNFVKDVITKKVIDEIKTKVDDIVNEEKEKVENEIKKQVDSVIVENKEIVESEIKKQVDNAIVENKEKVESEAKAENENKTKVANITNENKQTIESEEDDDEIIIDQTGQEILSTASNDLNNKVTTTSLDQSSSQGQGLLDKIKEQMQNFNNHQTQTGGANRGTNNRTNTNQSSAIDKIKQQIQRKNTHTQAQQQQNKTKANKIPQQEIQQANQQETDAVKKENRVAIKCVSDDVNNLSYGARYTFKADVMLDEKYNQQNLEYEWAWINGDKQYKFFGFKNEYLEFIVDDTTINELKDLTKGQSMLEVKVKDIKTHEIIAQNSIQLKYQDIKEDKNKKVVANILSDINNLKVGEAFTIDYKLGNYFNNYRLKIINSDQKIIYNNMIAYSDGSVAIKYLGWSKILFTFSKKGNYRIQLMCYREQEYIFNTDISIK